MATSAINIKANAQEVVNLRKRMDELKATLASMRRQDNTKLYDKLNNELQQSTIRYNSLQMSIQRYVSAQNRAGKATQDTTSGLGSMQSMLMKIGGTTAILGLGKQVLDVRNQFQQLEIAFGTMLKSTEKASSLMRDLTKFAAETPFGLDSAASGAKQLLAYGSTADTVIKELTMLGDVAAGTGQQIGDLVYLYGTLRTQGRAYLMDIRQFAGRGIPIYDELAKVLKINTDHVNDFVSAGKVGFKEVEQAFANMTSKGGLYGGLMEEQSKAIGGRLEALKDNISSIFNQIGKDNEGVIYKSIDGLNTLVENYDKVGKILVGLVATYGAYRTAVMLATIAESGWTIAQMAHFKALVVVEKAQKLLNATMLSNPYVLAATVLIGLVATVWALHDSTTAQEKAQERLNKRNEEAAKRKEDLQNETTRLIGIINSETASILQQVQAWDKLKDQYPEWVKNMSMAEFKALSLTEQQKLLNEALDSKTIKDTNAELQNQQKIVDDLKARIKEINLQESYTNTEVVKRLEILKDQLKKEDIHLEGLKKINKELEAQRLQAEFQAKSESERLGILKKQLEEFEKQRTSLEDNITKSGGLENAAKRVSPQFQMWGIQLNGVNGLINQIKNSIDSLDPTKTAKDKSFWKKQKEDAEGVLDMMDSAQLSLLKRGITKGLDPEDVESYKKATKDISEANKNLGLYDFSGKSERKADKVGESAADKALKEAQKIADDLEQLRTTNSQREIDAMADNEEKRLAQIELDYNKEIDLIKKKEKEWLEAQGGKLKTDQTLELTTAYSLAYNNKEKKTTEGDIDPFEVERKAWNDYFIEFGNYQEKRKAIIEKYNREIAETESEAQKQTLQKRGEKELADLDSSIIDSTDLMAQLFADSSQKSINEIKRIIDEVENLQKYLSGESAIKPVGFTDEQLEALKNDPEKLKAIQDALEKLYGGLENKSPFIAFKNNFNKALDEIKKGFDTGDSKLIGKGISNMGASIQDIIPELKEFGDSMGQIFGKQTGDDINTIVDLLGNTAQVGQGVGKIMSGDVVGGIKDAVTGIANIISMGSEASKRHKEALKQINEAIKAQERAYQLALRLKELEYEKGDSVFGDDPYGKAVNSAVVYKKTLADLKNSFAALNDAEVKTGHKKTGLFGWGKGKDTYSGLLEIYPDLIDAQGNFDLALAKTILAERELSKEGREALENAIEYAELAKQAYAAMKDYLSNIFGDLGNDMTNALVDAFANGTDAAEAFYKSASGMVQNLIKDMINAAVIAPIVQKASEEALKIMGDTSISEKERTKRLMDLVDNVIDEGLAASDRAKGMVDYANKEWEKRTGEKLFKPDKSQTPSSGYSVSMDQDTGDKLVGIATGSQMRLISLDQNVAKIASWNEPIGEKMNIDGVMVSVLSISESALRVERMVEEHRNIALGAYYELKDINKNTKQLYQMNERLEQIERNTREM